MDQKEIKLVAWVWLSLIVAGEGRAVGEAEIIEAGDYINHAVLTSAEVQNGLARLIELGFVEKTAKGHVLSAHGQAVYADLSKKKKDFYALMVLMENYLNRA